MGSLLKVSLPFLGLLIAQQARPPEVATPEAAALTGLSPSQAQQGAGIGSPRGSGTPWNRSLSDGPALGLSSSPASKAPRLGADPRPLIVPLQDTSTRPRERRCT